MNSPAYFQNSAFNRTLENEEIHEMDEQPFYRTETFTINLGHQILTFEDFEYTDGVVSLKSKRVKRLGRMIKLNLGLSLLLLILVFLILLKPVNALPKREDYYHQQRLPKELQKRQSDGLNSTGDFVSNGTTGTNDNSTGNPDVVPQKCSNSKEGSDCSVLADFKTSAIVLSGNQVSFVEGGCNSPIPQNPKGPYQGLVPCTTGGQQLNWGDCEFKACLANYGDIIDNEGTFETNGNEVIFTCRGEGTFIFIAPDSKANVNYKILFQFKYIAPEGLVTVKWSCGTGLKTTDLYTPKRAICKNSNFHIVCLNKHLEKAALAFTIFLFFTSLSFFELLDPFAWAMTILLIIPFIYFYYRAHQRSLAEVAIEYMKLTGKCPLCDAITDDPKYHLEHCPKNLKSELSEKDLRSWLFFRRLLHWGHKIAFWAEITVLLLLLIFAVQNIDTVGAIDVSKVISAPSTICSPFEVGASDAVATFIKGQTCSGTTCTGTVDIDTTIQGIEGFTQRFKLGNGLFLDIRVVKVYYYYTINRQYDACDSIILQSSTSSCGGDKCDVCMRKITNYLLNKQVPGTGDWGCNGGCIIINGGCTCSSCGHQKNGNCFMVGETQPNDLFLTIDVQSGGSCAEFKIQMNTKSNLVLITQLSEENKLNDMVAVKDNKVYQGSINRLGQFGGFGDLKFKSDTDLECKDDQQTYDHCKFGHVRTYIYTKCCSDTQSLASQLTVRADWIDNNHYIITDRRVGTFRLIMNIPDVPIARNPEDVQLTLDCKITSGCFSCAAGAKLEVKASATGPGWFDVTAEGGNVLPHQLVVNSGQNNKDFNIFIGFKTGSIKVNFGSYSCVPSYNLEDPGTDTTDASNFNTTITPGETCRFICGLSNFFHLPTSIISFITKALAALFVVIFIFIAIKLLIRAYRYEKEHHKVRTQKKMKEVKTKRDLESVNSPTKSSVIKQEMLSKSNSLKRRSKHQNEIEAAKGLKKQEKSGEQHQQFMDEMLEFEKSNDYNTLTSKDKIEFQMMKAKHRNSMLQSGKIL